MGLCERFAKVVIKEAGYKFKDVSATSCAGNWLVHTPKSEREIHAHCKFCAIVEVIVSEGAY